MFVSINACSSTPLASSAPVRPTAARLAPPAWLSDVPEGCALGDSGPTVVPSDALAEARRRARARLVTRTAPVTTKSIQLATGETDSSRDEVQEITIEQAQGWVRRSIVVALWYDADGVGPERAAGCAYAVACLRDSGRVETTDTARALAALRAGPDWLYALPTGMNGLCAVGVSGPTLKPADANANAEAAARAELAHAAALHARTATAIYEDDVLYAAVTHTCDGCDAIAAGARVVGRWVDDRAEGPIPFSGTTYAFLCLNP